MTLARLIALLVCLLPLTATAQGIGPQLPSAATTTVLAPDYDVWNRAAVRVERAVEGGFASTFALERMRAELTEWRDKLLAAQSLNAGRIRTVQQQIAALGASPPERANEPAAVSARRTDLAAQLATLRAPGLLAQEAYARANGLVSEIDALVRSRENARLSVAGPSPLNPENWPLGFVALWSGSKAVWVEVKAGLATDLRNGTFRDNLPPALALLLLALILLLRGRIWAMRIQGWIVQRAGRGAGVWRFFLSLLQIAVPFAGLLALSNGLLALSIFGFRGTTLIEILPVAGMFVIVGRWMSVHFFPSQEDDGGPLALTPAQCRKGRRIVFGLGSTLMLGTLLLTLIGSGDSSAAVAAVVVLPVQFLTCYFLFRLGRLMERHARGRDSQNAYRDRILGILGRGAMLVALAAPVLAMLGYANAAERLLYPSIITLALLGVLVLLQRLIFDTYGLFTDAPDRGRDALAPMLLAFVLLLAALPFLALIWGARTADLAELWTQFREGFSMGETRISPTIFLTFAVIFVFGYTLTRLIQGVLRTTVLPKTRIDAGGQNALVSGLGYIGIFLAALAAITGAGINLSSLAIVAGALSVGIGFGLQNIVSNFVSGIILLIERPISQGDWIEVGDQMGFVRDISVRSTRIETFDRTDVIIPNADLVSGQVINWTRGNSVGRVIVSVGVAYSSDVDKVATILREIAEAHPMVLLSPSPVVLFQAFGADSLNFEIRAILRDVLFVAQTKSELNTEIARRFAAEGVEIPFPQRDIWLRNPEVLRTGAKDDSPTQQGPLTA